MWFGVRRVDVPAPLPVPLNQHGHAAARKASVSKIDPDRHDPDRHDLGASSSRPPAASQPAVLPVARTEAPLPPPAAGEVVQASHVAAVAEPVPPPKSTAAITAPPADRPFPPALQATGATASPVPVGGTEERGSSASRADDSASSGLYHIALAQLGCTLVAAIAGPLLAVLAFWVILRRHGRRHGPLLRFEFANPSQHDMAVPAVNPPSLTRVSVAPEVPAAPPLEPDRRAVPEPETRAATFELGATYADGVQQKHNVLGNREEGILRHIVEQNLKLMEQIGDLEPLK